MSLLKFEIKLLENNWSDLKKQFNNPRQTHFYYFSTNFCKGKCENCKVVSYFKTEKGVKLSDRKCLECKGEVKRTSINLEGYKPKF